MTINDTIAGVLSSPLEPNWTVESLAERVLGAIASQPPESGQEFVITGDDTIDRQSRRLLRPLLACLATRSASESGAPVNLYGGQLSFERQGPTGPVWVLGHFENRPGSVRLAMRRSNSPAVSGDVPRTDPSKPGRDGTCQPTDMRVPRPA